MQYSPQIRKSWVYSFAAVRSSYNKERCILRLPRLIEGQEHRAAKNVVDDVINMSGVAQARSVSQSQGEIIFSGDENGSVNVTGLVDASGKTNGLKGGSHERRKS